jgi:hypothetical protein
LQVLAEVPVRSMQANGTCPAPCPAHKNPCMVYMCNTTTSKCSKVARK